MRRRAVLKVVIAVAVVGFAGFVAVIVHLGPIMDFNGVLGRKQLRPIAIPSSACPSLGLVRVTASQAGEGWLHELNANAPPWRDFAGQLAPKLERFSIALHVAIPRAPAPVAARLQRILHEVEIGQRELPASIDVFQYLSATNDAVWFGQAALHDASDLVGWACGAPLYDETVS